MHIMKRLRRNWIVEQHAVAVKYLKYFDLRGLDADNPKAMNAVLFAVCVAEKNPPANQIYRHNPPEITLHDTLMTIVKNRPISGDTVRDMVNIFNRLRRAIALFDSSQKLDVFKAAVDRCASIDKHRDKNQFQHWQVWFDIYLMGADVHFDCGKNIFYSIINGRLAAESRA